MTQTQEALALAAALAAGFVAGLVVFATPAPAHDWYPSDCCSAYDCYEIDRTELEPMPGGGWRVRETGEVFSQSDGWQTGIYSGATTFHPRVRQTPPEAGGTWHRCSKRAGDRSAATICLFVPPIGF